MPGWSRAGALSCLGPMAAIARGRSHGRPVGPRSGITAPRTLLGGVSPGLSAFPARLGQDPEGMIAVAQWHPRLGAGPGLGPSSSEVVREARARGVELDYVGAQAYAAALIAAHCLELAPDDPRAAARMLRTTTFYGAFELDRATGIQQGHRLCVVRWRGGRRELL